MTKISKDDYILRMLSKIRHKKWENYVVNRIVHRLDDPEVEFVCQQCIRREATHALVDLYFPQFKLIVEVDEPHHENDDNKKKDIDREEEITNIIDGAVVKRIKVKDPKSLNGVKTLQVLNAEIDKIVEWIRCEKNMLGDRFSPWNYRRLYDPQTYIDGGALDVADGASFWTHRDALICFGYRKGHLQKAVWDVPGTNKIVWFPKLYENAGWENKLVSNPSGPPEIHETTKLENHVGKNPEDEKNRIVFAHDKDALGRVFYRFLGEFQIVPDLCNKKTTVFRLVRTVVDLRPFHPAA